MNILLKRLGFDVIFAANGLDALKLLKVTEPNLIMLDIIMPGMDGITTLRHIKEDEKTSNIPVIMLTTEAKEETIDECKKLGCSGYILKPIKIEGLHEVLQEYLYLPSGCKRKHIRVTYNEMVTVIYENKTYEVNAVNLSEGGMYLFKRDPFPVGSEVKVTLYLDEGQVLHLDASVIYIRVYNGDLLKNPPGMALKFKNLPHDDSMILKNYVNKLVAGDVLDTQEVIV
jgi:two-component system cell cycle response regulator DivK